MTSVRAGACAAALMAIATFYAGTQWGSAVGGGADSYGYVSQAALWRTGNLTIREPIARQSPWPFAIQTWAPLGYRAAPGSRDAIVPLYAPGLPLLMAAFQAIGGFCAAFFVVPISAALTVWLTYVLGQLLFGRPATSLAAAGLVATSPIFLYQLMNPMSDIPATAAWALATVLAAADWPLFAGLVASIALVIRPNLALIAVVLVAWTVVTRKPSGRLILGLLPALVAVALVNARLFGAPWLSGYGSADDLYALRYIGTNVRQFGGWLLETQTPIVALALLYFVVPAMCPSALVPYPRFLLGGTVGALVLSYVFYIPFDAWWYLRFLLPMWPVTMILTVVTIEAVVTRGNWGAWVGRVAVGTLIVGLAANGIRIAAAHSAFELGRSERKYIDVARFIASHTEPDAVMISLQHSGTLRLYGGRLTLRFDQLDGRWLDRAVGFLRDRGRHPYIVLDGPEVEFFKRRFAVNELGSLEWRPLAMSSNPAVFVYDAVNRDSSSEPLAIGVSSSRRGGGRCDPPYEGRVRTE